MSMMWQKLIHNQNNENQIVSKEFYLSSNKNATQKEEFEATKKLFKSSNGLEAACAFPARYEFIKSNFSDIPIYNLQSCKELNRYLDSFPKDKLSIVFTSEYTNNPSSAFGHIMLLFSKDNTPLEVGDVVHFAAKTSTDDGFLKYSYKGMTGQYNGYFIREPFFKKIYEYNTLEQRYMYIYTLDLTKDEIKTILYHLFELRKATFKYYFLDGNCASQTTDLLNIINKDSSKKSFYYLPIQTVNDLKNRVKNKDRFIPLLNKLNLLIQSMTPEEKELFNELIKTQKEIDKNTPDIIKEAMTIYTTFNFRRFHKINRNYENVMSQTYQKQNIIDTTPDPLLKTKPSNIGLGYYTNKNEDYLLFQYRPLFIDLLDIQNNDLQESQTNTFTFDLLINNDNIKLNKFDFINIKSLPLQSDFYNPISWNIHSGFDRENKKENLSYNNEIGIGRTLSLNYFTRISFLADIGADNLDYYIKPNALINIYTSSNSKIGIASSYKKYDGDFFYQNYLYTSYKYRDYLFTLKYDNDNSENNDKYLISIKYNF
ncbi:MAG: DUF4105 domain-containing protein [Aliarcobacter sp.]|nr:DUF4105 domain-containing protein [Aliarcobacter sp.]